MAMHINNRDCAHFTRNQESDAKMIVPIELARWRRLQSTEATASQYASASASRYRSTGARRPASSNVDCDGLDTATSRVLCFAQMDQSSPPSIGQFLRVAYQDWTTLMSGAATIPFTILATAVPSTWGYARLIFGVMAALFFSATVYRVWAG